MITKHNLNPTNQKQEAMNLIVRSIRQEFLWSKAEVEQLQNKVLIDYGITEPELDELFNMAGYMNIVKPQTRLEELFKNNYVNKEAIEEIKGFISGNSIHQWRANQWRNELDPLYTAGIDQLYKDYTALGWQMSAKDNELKEQLMNEHKTLMDRLSQNHPTYYKNDPLLKNYWTKLIEEAKIF